MNHGNKSIIGLISAILVIGIATPLIIFALLVGCAPTIGAPAAHELVKARSHVLVDTGVSPELAVYLQDTVKWPMASLMQAKTINDVPPQLLSRKLLLICNAGILSAQAALHLKDIGVDAVSVRGGAQQYISAVPGCSLNVLLHRDAAVDASIPAFRASPLHEQWAVVISFFGVKLIYTLMSLAIVVQLWRRREIDLTAVCWAMLFFFVGEMFCFLNVMVCFEDSLLMEHLHSLGMVLSMAWASYALFEGMDARLIHFSDEGRCAATTLCRVCDKRTNAECGLRRMFLLLIPATALLAFLPLFSEFRNVTYNTRVLGVLHSYRHPVMHQFYELRYLPVAALVLLAICFVVLWRVERRSVTFSKILYAAALGALGFSYFRLVLVASFINNQVWFVLWEETTELMYVGLVAGVLLIFTRGLLSPAQPNKSEVRA